MWEINWAYVSLLPMFVSFIGDNQIYVYLYTCIYWK